MAAIAVNALDCRCGSELARTGQNTSATRLEVDVKSIKSRAPGNIYSNGCESKIVDSIPADLPEIDPAALDSRGKAAETSRNDRLKGSLLGRIPTKVESGWETELQSKHGNCGKHIDARFYSSLCATASHLVCFAVFGTRPSFCREIHFSTGFSRLVFGHFGLDARSRSLPSQQVRYCSSIASANSPASGFRHRSRVLFLPDHQ